MTLDSLLMFIYLTLPTHGIKKHSRLLEVGLWNLLRLHAMIALKHWNLNTYCALSSSREEDIPFWRFCGVVIYPQAKGQNVFSKSIFFSISTSWEISETLFAEEGHNLSLIYLNYSIELKLAREMIL